MSSTAAPMDASSRCVAHPQFVRTLYPKPCVSETLHAALAGTEIMSCLLPAEFLWRHLGAARALC